MIDKDSTKVTDDIDDTEDDTALGQHGQERTALVVLDGTAVLVCRVSGAVSFGAGNRFQSVVNLLWGADQVVIRGIHGEQERNQHGEDDRGVQVRRHKRRLQAAGHRVHDNTHRNQETSDVDVHTSQGVHSSRASQNQQRRNDYVCQEAKEQEYFVSGGTPSGVDNFTNSVSVRSIPLHLNRQDTKQKHLDRGTGRVPKRTGNTILIRDV